MMEPPVDGVSVRPLHADDAAEVHALEAAAYPLGEAASRAKIDYRLAHASHCAMACVDATGRIIGYVLGTAAIGVMPRLQEETMSQHADDGTSPLSLCIHSVVVEKSLRRRGLGQWIAKEYIKMIGRGGNGLEQVKKILLICKLEKIPFYHSCGFKLSGKSIIIYGQDAWYDMAIDTEDHFQINVPMVQVDAFTPIIFGGNPAAVQFEHGSVEWMQSCAFENNLSETAFLQPVEGAAVPTWDIRFFTPTVEVDLCGHATLASAHALWATGRTPLEQDITFVTQNAGELTARQPSDGWIRLEFPALELSLVDQALGEESRGAVAAVLDALGLEPEAAGTERELLVGPPLMRDLVVPVSRDEWQRIPDTPSFAKLKSPSDQLGLRGIIVTVKGGPGIERASKLRPPEEVHFSSRFFGPSCGVPEDPVTGSAHCLLTKYWDGKCGPAAGQSMIGFQASRRGGLLRVTMKTERVWIEGSAVTVLKGFTRRPQIYTSVKP